VIWEVFLIAILAVNIAGVVDIVESQGQALSKLFWIGVVLVLPVLGVVLYVVLGRQRVRT